MNNFNDIKEWTKTVIERLGHIVIASAEGEKEKVKQYKKVVKNLRITLNSIVKQARAQKDITIKNEASLLLSKIKILETHIKKDF